VTSFFRLSDTPDIDSSELIESFKTAGDRRDSTDSGKKVRWKDEGSDSSMDENDASGYEEDSEASCEEHCALRPQMIEIQHTPISDIIKVSDLVNSPVVFT
jgi:hypothetical protein